MNQVRLHSEILKWIFNLAISQKSGKISSFQISNLQSSNLPLSNTSNFVMLWISDFSRHFLLLKSLVGLTVWVACLVVTTSMGRRSWKGSIEILVSFRWKLASFCNTGVLCHWVGVLDTDPVLLSALYWRRSSIHPPSLEAEKNESKRLVWYCQYHLSIHEKPVWSPQLHFLVRLYLNWC